MIEWSRGTGMEVLETRNGSPSKVFVHSRGACRCGESHGPAAPGRPKAIIERGRISWNEYGVGTEFARTGSNSFTWVYHFRDGRCHCGKDHRATTSQASVSTPTLSRSQVLEEQLPFAYMAVEVPGEYARLAFAATRVALRELGLAGVDVRFFDAAPHGTSEGNVVQRLETDAAGWSKRDRAEIWLRAGLDPKGLVAICAHECAHVRNVGTGLSFEEDERQAAAYGLAFAEDYWARRGMRAA